MESSNAKSQTQSLITRLATRHGVEAGKLWKCLTTQVFKQADGAVPTTEEMMVLLLVCENYDLNPFAREIFAFRGKSGDIVPVVSLDGWARIVRSQKDFDGMTFTFSNTTVKIPSYPGELPEYVTCSMRLKGVSDPVMIQEYMVECFNDRSPVWKKWPRRMLRTRSFIQCARLAFSLTGLYDEGDAYSDDGFNGRLTLQGMESALTTPASAEAPKLAMDRTKLDVMLTKLATLAVGRENGWERAQQWVSTNLAGEDRAYAEAVLKAKAEPAATVATDAVMEPGKTEAVPS